MFLEKLSGKSASVGGGDVDPGFVTGEESFHALFGILFIGKRWKPEGFRYRF